MQKVEFLHNKRCSKSKDALKILTDSKKGYTLREYIKNPFDLNDLLEVQEKLGLKAIEFTRVNEKEFKEAGLTKNSDDLTILKAMAKFPKIMERPIFINGDKAVVCRPPEKIKEIL